MHAHRFRPFLLSIAVAASSAVLSGPLTPTAHAGDVCISDYLHGFAGAGPSVTPGNFNLAAIRVWDDGTGPALYVAGRFTAMDGVPALNIAKWDGTQWSPLGDGVGTAGTAQSAQVLEVFDDGTGEKLYVGGNFLHASNVPGTANLATWDGTNWLSANTAGTGMSGAIYAMTVGDMGAGPRLFVGAGRNIHQTDGTTWSPTTGAVNNGGIIWAMAVFVKHGVTYLYIGGQFTSTNGVSTPNIARFNGTTWSSAGGFNEVGYIRALHVHDDGSGSALYAGGLFTNIGAVGASRIARLPSTNSGANWEAMGSGIGGNPGCQGCQLLIQDIATLNDANGPALYIAGNFQTVGGVTSPHLARWQNGSWNAVGSGGPAGSAGSEVPNVKALSGYVSSGCAAFTPNDEPVLFFAGNFTSVAGQSDNFLSMVVACSTESAGPVGDLNGDGWVNISDLLALLAVWGPCGESPCGCPGDFNDDGAVDLADLLILLANWT